MDYGIAMIMLAMLIGLLSSGCALKGKQITTSGYTAEPRMAWNGSHFGIVYYQGPGPGIAPEIKVVKVDPSGNIVISPKKISGVINSVTTPFRLSDLVWNNNDKQFAFGYSVGKAIFFVRLDSNLNVIGSPLEIKFNVLDYEHPFMEDLSLVWSKEKKEFTLTYITREVVEGPERHDYVFCSQISSSGKFLGLKNRVLVKISQKDCKRTSVAYNPKTGKYGVAYFKDSVPMLGIFGATGYAAEHKLTTSTYKTWKEAIRLLCDEKTGDFFVAELSYAGELESYFLDKNGSILTKRLNAGKGYDKLYSIANFPSFDAVFLCASQHKQIRCWAMNKSGDIKPDIVSPASGVYTSQPSVAVLGLSTYMCWIQNQLLYFGLPKLK